MSERRSTPAGDGVTPLPPERLAELEAAPFTYAPVGGTRGELPPGYGHLRRSRVIGAGLADFERAGAATLGWQVHVRSGLHVAASAPVAALGVVVECRLGFGRLAMRIPCRVVYTLDEPRRLGFAYGTLPGHPETGEESFVVALRDDGRVELQVTAFANPAWRLARAVAPVSRLGQELAVRRYLRALDPLLRAGGR